MENETQQTSLSLPPDQPPEVDTTPKKKQKKRKRRDKAGSASPDAPIGCLDVLKKISCTLACGGTVCSVQEQDTGSVTTDETSSSASRSPSLETVQPATVPSRPKTQRRPRVSKTSADTASAPENSPSPPKKKAPRVSKRARLEEAVTQPMV